MSVKAARDTATGPMDREPDTCNYGRSATGCGPYHADLPTNRNRRTKEGANEMDETVSIADAAAECGVSVGTLISQMVDAGTFLVTPGAEDPRCQLPTPAQRAAYRFRCDDTLLHVDDCKCRFIPVPHPDLVELGR